MRKGRVLVRITEDLIERIIKQEQGLPQDAKVVDHHYNFNLGIWYVKLEHESFDENSRDAPIPIWEPPTTNSATISIKVADVIIVTDWAGNQKKYVNGNIVFDGGHVLAPGLGAMPEGLLYDDLQPKPEDPPKKKKWREFL